MKGWERETEKGRKEQREVGRGKRKRKGMRGKGENSMKSHEPSPLLQHFTLT